jgi:pterin-4a-carbinolamine dehydratase
MMLNSLMKDYLKEKEISSGFERELFGLVRESVEVPLAPEKSEWIIAPDPERLVRKFMFEDIEARNWFLKELLDDEIKSGHNGKIIIDGTDAMIEVWTHDISAVTELDLEYAARCDDIFSDVALLGELEYEYR